MSKSVLMSIKPQFCELIANRKKTVEVRKTRPKLKTPFKCYIYCTKGEQLWKRNNKILLDNTYNRLIDNIPECLLNEKVIGEFICDNIINIYECIEVHDEIISRPCEYWLEWDSDDDIVSGTCLPLNEIEKYLSSEDGYGYGYGYGWHISDLKIYDKLKELRNFKKYNRTCYYNDLDLGIPKCDDCKECQLTRSPQSWCYVEGVQ